MNRSERRRQFELRTVYLNAWNILSTWATCCCEPGTCPLEAELSRLGIDPGTLLAAVALGQPELIGVAR